MVNQANQFRVGSIVVVEEPRILSKRESMWGTITYVTALGNIPGTITKIVSKPNEVMDSIFEITGDRGGTSFNNLSDLNVQVFCEAVNSSCVPIIYRNKEVHTENLLCLRLATEEEKVKWRKYKKQQMKQNNDSTTHF